jgi:hypothetical protein
MGSQPGSKHFKRKMHAGLGGANRYFQNFRHLFIGQVVVEVQYQHGT